MSLPLSAWDKFRAKHILNPTKNEHHGYESWDKRQQNNWLRHRLAAFEGERHQAYGRKRINSVIIATSNEILSDFKNPGVKLERKSKQDDYYWSNRKYSIWLFEKKSPSDSNSSDEQQYSVTNLKICNGSMHFLARTTRDQNGHHHTPVHFEKQHTEPTQDLANIPKYGRSK